jgi:hypothetical protein
MYLISDTSFGDNIYANYQGQGGAYKIIAIRHKEPVQICRWLGTDPEGIIYIGKADLFTDRVIRFKLAILRHNGNGHIACRRYKSIPNIGDRFPYNIMYAELFPSDHPKQMEMELRRDYMNQFGEVPPLNAIC